MRKNSNRILLNFMICFVCFAIPMGLFLSLMFMSLFKGMVLGLISGVLFAILCSSFVMFVASRKDKLKEQYGIQEDAFYDGGATYIMEKASIAIYTNDGKQCEFFVNEYREWLDILQEKIA